MCLKCLYHRPTNVSTFEDLKHTNSQEIWTDLRFLSARISNVFARLPSYLNSNPNSADFFSTILKTAVEFIQTVERVQLESKLMLFSKENDVVRPQVSSVANSKLFIPGHEKITELAKVSTIITTKEDEAFVLKLFGLPVELKLLFRASRDGFDAHSFHRACDLQGATLSFYQSNKNKIFGGFSDKSWKSALTFKHSKESFLFSVTSKKKLRSFRNFDRALFFSENSGPSFGEDLMIGKDSSVQKSCRSFLGRAYETFEGFYESAEAQKSLAGFPVFSLLDFEVYLIKFTGS